MEAGFKFASILQDSEQQSAARHEETREWYALRTFGGRVFRIKEEIEEAGMHTYMAMREVDRKSGGQTRKEEVQIIPQLLFVRCPQRWLRKFKEKHFGEVMLYCDHPGGTPMAIRDKEMELFMFVTSTNYGRDIEYLGESMPHFEENERVLVIDGIYKGTTGFIKRIRKDRKLLVAVEGVAVVAISHIPMSYLQKIGQDAS